MKIRHVSLLCLAALLGVNLCGCAAIYRFTRPVNESLQAPLIEMPDQPGAEQPAQRAARKPAAGQATEAPAPVVRSQSPGAEPGSYGGAPMRPTDVTAQAPVINRYTQPGAPIMGQSPVNQPAPGQPFMSQPGGGFPTAQPGLPAPPADAYPPGGFGQPTVPFLDDPRNAPQTPQEALTRPSDLDIFVQEAKTGRFSFGVAVNSNIGLTGQITVDERNFDLFRWARSWDDVTNGGAFRGGGQYLHIEASPGSVYQRYLVSLTEPYLFGTNITGSVSASYMDRNYFDYFDSRFGGVLGLGYRLTPDLAFQSNLRAENVGISQPRVLGVPELERVIGRNDIFGEKVRLLHDTRDLPLFPTEGHYFDLSYEQVFGDFDFGRGEIDYYQYYTIRERPDGSGRHVLAFTTQLGLMGKDAPLFENYFAGGYTNLRGFNFRGASPIDKGVRVGGNFKFLNSAEYFFPLTADDMLKGVVFCDYGVVERTTDMHDKFRVAPGFGLRINVPALGPAPLALDFAFPVSKEPTDQLKSFSFFFGVSRQ